MKRDKKHQPTSSPVKRSLQRGWDSVVNELGDMARDAGEELRTRGRDLLSSLRPPWSHDDDDIDYDDCDDDDDDDVFDDDDSEGLSSFLVRFVEGIREGIREGLNEDDEDEDDEDDEDDKDETGTTGSPAVPQISPGKRLLRIVIFTFLLTVVPFLLHLFLPDEGFWGGIKIVCTVHTETLKSIIKLFADTIVELWKTFFGGK